MVPVPALREYERVGWMNFRELGMSKWSWDYEIQFLTKIFVEVPIFRLLVIKHHIELSQVTVMVDFRFQFILISKFKKLTNIKQPTMSFPWIADICSWYFEIVPFTLLSRDTTDFCKTIIWSRKRAPTNTWWYSDDHWAVSINIDHDPWLTLIAQWPRPRPAEKMFSASVFSPPLHLQRSPIHSQLTKP